jgi:ribosome-associated protein
MDDVRINRTCVVPGREVKFRFSRSSGPGGQNVNKRSTQVELIFDVAGSKALGPRQRTRALQKLASRLDNDGRLHIVASEERTQGRNREIALERFRRVMSDALRPPPPKRRPTRPSKRANERRISGKRRRGALKRTRSVRPDDD